ncbi:MAG TPA: response regulator [Burkholderiales bacterium]|nr:response regulator [Burkholderiales bacterium]
MSEAPVVHIVDDDASFGRSLARLLGASGFQVRGFSSGAELLAAVSPQSEGCVVADLAMPGIGGLELQDELSRLGVPLPVVFLTGRGDIPSSVRAMRGGAVDFLEKHAPKEALLAAVQRALASGRHAAGLRRRFSALTQRELQVLQHVVRGRMNKQIAADLGIHERTVKLHRTALTTKLGVRSAAELATLARDAGVAT